MDFFVYSRDAAGKNPVQQQSIPEGRLILYGALTALEDSRYVGVALALQAPDREAVDALLETGGSGRDVFPEIEIHDWEFGGRR